MATDIPDTDRVTSAQQEVIEQRVRQIVAKALELDVDEVQLSSSLVDELGAESLDLLDIAFMLERAFKIEFPRIDILERAAGHFGEESLVVDGVVTDFGLALLRRGMPEIASERLQAGTRDVDVMRMITVQSFVRIVTRLLEAKEQFPRTCPACGAMMEESDIMPEFVCPACGTIQPLPSGDEILLQDLIALADDRNGSSQ
ncbi:MAG TPA: hypothetical protein DEP84_13055 [Chloroflexi bacterium]|nr:hypothetical protein [Chloroflexota bacterium]